MLDANLVKFVEPIGPGQIVDRESLVALHAGQLKVTIETSHEHIIVRVLAMRGIDGVPMDDNLDPVWNVHSYIWQNGQVIAAERLLDSTTRNFVARRTLGTLGRRRSPGTRNFRFTKESPDHAGDNSVIDAILQICVYKSTNMAAQLQRKTFIGTVHVALNYLTSNEFQCPEDGITCREEWFKVFPKSTFLPGCPQSIAKTNCAVSGHAQPQTSQQEAATPPRHRDITRTQSTISFKQYNLKVRQRSDSIASSTISGKSESSDLAKTPATPNNDNTVKSRITTWVKTKLLRQNTAPVLTPKNRRTPETTKCEHSPDIAPVIVGLRRRAYTSPSRMMTAKSSPTPTSPVTTTTPVTQSESERLPIPQEVFRSAKGSVRKANFKASGSNNSSFDIGYESARSRCLSSSDEESVPISDDSNLKSLRVKESDDAKNCNLRHECDSEAGDRPTSSASQKSLPKKRCGVLKRSKRISQTDSLPPLKGIHRQNSVGGSFDSVIIANS